jgi:hypothetical protein
MSGDHVVDHRYGQRVHGEREASVGGGEREQPETARIEDGCGGGEHHRPGSHRQYDPPSREAIR